MSFTKINISKARALGANVVGSTFKASVNQKEKKKGRSAVACLACMLSAVC